MPFGAQVRTNLGLIDISSVFGLKLIDKRSIYLSATEDNRGSFTVPLGDYTSFNNTTFRVFCNAGNSLATNPSVRGINSLMTEVTFPSTISSSSTATVSYRGGRQATFTFITWIAEI